jgi:hypothetical protein
MTREAVLVMRSDRQPVRPGRALAMDTAQEAATT